MDKKDLYARIQKYDSKEYFLEYIYAHDNNWDTKPQRSLPSYIKIQKYPAYTGSHLSAIRYVFDDRRDVRKTTNHCTNAQMGVKSTPIFIEKHHEIPIHPPKTPISCRGQMHPMQSDRYHRAVADFHARA